jgi:hypothetical protein
LELGSDLTLVFGIPASSGKDAGPADPPFVLQHGRFDAEAAHLTAVVLVHYCIGLPLVD